MRVTATYDSIGVQYRDRRRPDAGIQGAIEAALGDARSVVNVGAGTGSYESAARAVIAVEPSMTMIEQRPAGAAPVVRAPAEALPFGDAIFDAATAVLTIHHWSDWRRGTRELVRCARKAIVILTWDPAAPRFWLVEDYFPEIFARDARLFPSIEDLRLALGSASVSRVMIPHDCTDGFLGAYWRRPDAYLDASVRRAISTFARLEREPGSRPAVTAGLDRLRADLASGAWHDRHRDLLLRDSFDLGYRLVVRT